MDDSLSFESFLRGSKRAAHKAMDDHGRAEYDEFALHAGVAVERLAKAVLVSKNPLYIAEMRGSAEMLFHLGGHRTAGKVRTIGAMEAIARLRTLDVLPSDRQLDLLIDLRNGVAHTASENQGKSLLSTFAETVQTLHGDLGGPLASFWGRWTTVVRLAVDQERSQVYRDVQVRVRQARHNFEDRFAGLPQNAMELVLRNPVPMQNESIGPMTLADGRDVVLKLLGADCPACSGRASVFFDKVSPLGGGALRFVPTSMKCVMCALELNSTEEIEASGARTHYQTAPLLPEAVADLDAIDIGETQPG
ncbi:hypothetical protein [Streptomyces niveus]|uniref:hypothetical protein n=1 Tax=Streptomyces niveus TaxID=193462 RepID=UPI0033BC3800